MKIKMLIMKKPYSENNGFTYTKKVIINYPNIAATETEKIVLGKYGRPRLNYLKEYKEAYGLNQ